MSNGYFLADTNSLVYAYRAGGPELLDLHIKVATAGDRKFAITERVFREIDDGPLKRELLHYIADKNITVLPNPLTKQLVASGKITSTSAGEVSMLEVATREHEAGRVTRIWADDKYFDSEQIMRNHPDAHRTMSAALLDEAYEQTFIGADDHQRFRAGYQTQQVFLDSPRLNDFRYNFSAPDPHMPALAKAAIGAGVLATAYDAAVSGRDAWELHQQGNAVGAESKVMQFGVRNAGAWAGALMGAKAGTLAGVESGPGMLVTGIVGAGIGAWGAERVVDWIEQNKINTQTDRNGVQWRFDPENAEKGWQRDVVDAFAERGLSLKHTETAPPDIADALNFKASTMAVQLRLSSPDIAVNPFEIAADANDTRSLRESPWIREPETKEWRREVADGMIDRVMHTYTEKASTEKSAELDAYAQSVIVYNAARSPAAVAAHFEDVYRDNGWARHGDGQLPPAVRHAREDLETLVASDGDRYRRQQNGEWISDGLIHDSTAQGNLRDELNATHTALQTRWMPAPLSPSAQESAIGIEPRALDPASEQQRDVHEQAQREANREGLSLDESRLAIAAPVRMATAGRREDGSHESDAPHDDRRQERAVNGADSMAMAASTPPLPVRLPDPRDADHPGHPLYKQIERGVAGVDALHPGDRGPEVWTLQDNLIRSGVNERLPNPVQAHGAYDQATQRGVMAFQLQQGLEPTGIADAITREVVQQRMVAHVQTSPSLTPTHATYAPLAQQTPVTTPPAPEAPTAGVDAHWQQQRVREQQARMRAQTRHEEEAKRREEEPTRQTFDPLAAASSQTSKPARIEDHPALPGIRQALCDKLEQQGQLAGVSDDRLTEIAGQLHRKGLRAGGRWAASIRNDTFFAQDQELARCGFRMKLDFSQPPPSPEQTLQEVATFDRQQALDAQAIAEQRQREQDDPGRKPTM